MAATLGSAVDVQRAQALLGKGLAQAQGAAASGQILGQTIGGIGNILGGMNFGSQGATSPVGYGTVLAPPSGGFPSAAQTAGSNLISGFQGLFK
jgi:hypothetical protein